MDYRPSLEANNVVTGDGNIRITHRIDKKMLIPAQSAVYPVPFCGDWEEFHGTLKDPDVMNLAEYLAEVERKYRLRSTSILCSLDNKVGFGPRKANIMMDMEVSLPGEVCTIQCIGLCEALRELREKRAAARKRLARRKKITKDASN